MYKYNSKRKKNSRSSWSSSCNNIIYTILILGIRMRDIHTNFQRSDAIFNNVGSREKYSQWVYERHNAKIKILENLHRRDDLKCTNAMRKKKKMYEKIGRSCICR